MFVVLTKAVNEQYLQLTGEKDAHITKTEAIIHEGESEIQQLRHAVTRCVYVPVIPVNWIFWCQKKKKSHWRILLATSSPQCRRSAHGCAKGLRGIEAEAEHNRSWQRKPVPEDDCRDWWPQQNQDQPWRAAHRAYKVWPVSSTDVGSVKAVCFHVLMKKGVHLLFEYLPPCYARLLSALWSLPLGSACFELVLPLRAVLWLLLYLTLLGGNWVWGAESWKGFECWENLLRTGVTERLMWKRARKGGQYKRWSVVERLYWMKQLFMHHSSLDWCLKSFHALYGMKCKCSDSVNSFGSALMISVFLPCIMHAFIVISVVSFEEMRLLPMYYI